MANTQIIAAVTEELTSVASSLRLSTVQVRSGRGGVGSGVIWSSGLIITNSHVVHKPSARVELSDGRVFDAEVTARDRHQDLAALVVEAADLPVASIGDSDALRVGELVLAVGNPLGLVGAVSTGIISSVAPNDTGRKNKWLMADVRVAPGNSGGPLADARGRVVGINSMIVEGLTFAVPSNAVERFLRGTNEARPYLGVTMQPVRVPLEDKRVFGLLVLEVASGSTAEAAGLLTGDVLIGASSQLFNAPDDLVSALWHSDPSGRLQLDVIRGGQRIACIVQNLRGGTNEGLAA